MYQWMRKTVVFVFAGAVFVGGVGAWLVYLHLSNPSTVRTHVLHAVRQLFPDARIELGAAHLSLLGGIQLTELAIYEPTPTGAYVETLRFPNLALAHDRSELMNGKLAIHKIRLQQPTITLEQQDDGQWKLPINPRSTQITFPRSMQVQVQAGTLRLLPLRQQPIELTQINVDLTLTPPAAGQFQITAQHISLPGIGADGVFNLNDKRVEGRLRTTQPVALPTLLATLPKKMLDAAPIDLSEVAQQIVGNVTAECQGTVQILNGRPHYEGVGAIELLQVGVHHPLLPHPIERLTGKLELAANGLKANRLLFDWGGAKLGVNLAVPGWQLDQLSAGYSARGLTFEPLLRDRLPPALQKIWNDLQPEGQFDLDGTVQWVNDRPFWKGTMRTADAAGTFCKFPARVQHIRAELLFEGRQASFSGVGELNGRPVQAEGQVGPELTLPSLHVTLRSDRVPFNDVILKALPERTHNVLQHMTGEIIGSTETIVKRTAGQPFCDVMTRAHLSARRFFCRQWFPYEMHDVSGQLTVTPSRTFMTGFVGKAGDSSVSLEGELNHAVQGCHVELKFDADQLALDEKLRQALPPRVQSVWDTLHPEGKVRAQVTVFGAPEQPTEVRATVYPIYASVTPDVFPAPLDWLAGPIEYANNECRWRDLQIRQERSEIRLSGSFMPFPDRQVLTFENVQCPSLELTQRLRTAMPAEIRRIIDHLRPNRPITLGIQQYQVTSFPEASRPTEHAIVGAVGLRNTNVLPDIGLENVTGICTMSGGWAGARKEFKGNLELSQLTVAGFTAQKVQSQLKVSDQEIRLANIKGSFYDGRLHGDIIADADTLQYECRLSAFRARLAKYVQEGRPDAPPVDGMVDAYVYLTGRGGQKGLDGGGWLNINDADIAKLPAILSLYQVLSFQAPNERSIDKVHSTFRLQGRSMLLDRLEIEGPALSLTNERPGVIDLEHREVDAHLSLRFRPRWAKGSRLIIPPVSEFLNSTSDQLMLVTVAGRLEAPSVHPEPVPGLKRLLTGRDRPAPK